MTSWRSVTLATVAAWVLAVAPLAVLAVRQDLDLHPSSWFPVAVGAVLVSVLVSIFAPERVRGLLSAVAVLAGSGVLVSTTPLRPGDTWAIANIVLLGLLPTAWAWSLGVAMPRRIAPRAGLIRSAIPFLVGAAVLFPLIPDVRAGLVPAAAGLVLVAVNAVPRRPRPPGEVPRSLRRRVVAALGRLARRVGRPIGRVAGAVAMLPAAAMVLAEWAVHRVLRYDPMAFVGAGDSRWVSRSGADPDTTRRFAGLTEIEPRRRRLHRGAVTAVHVVAVVAAVVLVAPHTTSLRSRVRDLVAPTTTVPEGGEQGPSWEACIRQFEVSPLPVVGKDPGWPELGCLTSAFVTHPRADASTVFTFDDFASQHINELDGVRRSWTPPACTCRRIRVWWVGGSAAWGYQQRDEYTIPSMLARAAWSEGIALDMVNIAMPGWAAGQEVRRVGELASGPNPPDLVVFYDGGNDLAYQVARNGRGAGADDSPISSVEVEINELLLKGPDWIPTRSTTTAPVTLLSDARVAEVVMTRYRRDMDQGRRLAASMGAEAVGFWQPMGPVAPPAVGPGYDPARRRSFTAMRPTITAMLPPGVVDLTGVLDDAPRRVFSDDLHTTQLGVDIVSRRVFDELRPRLVALANRPAS